MLNTTYLKGINEVDLLIESFNRSAEKCSITEKQIETNCQICFIKL